MSALAIQAKAARVIRAELKTNFTGIKFDVKSRGSQLGRAIEISWNGGPESWDVFDLVGKYQFGWLADTNDIYEFQDKYGDIPQVGEIITNRN